MPGKSKMNRSSERGERPASRRSLGRKLLIGLERFLVAVAAAGLCLLLSVMILTTAIPAWLWSVLALGDGLMIFLLFRIKPHWRAAAGGLGGMVVISLIGIAASQFFAATPAITDASGQPVAGSIATLEQIELNGSKQWITIRGHDPAKPVLLNLGMGGPGGGGFATRSLFTPLEKHFVVVSWDEPGTGKSYNAVPFNELTPQRFIDDAHALTLYLRERFHQDKIYVYGVSWTSILGVWLVQDYPELYHAYIGNGQMVNTTQNDVMGYELAIAFSLERGDTATVETLRRNGPPPYDGDGLLMKYVAFLDVLNEYMGAPRYTLVVPVVPFLASEYGMVDKINHTRGLMQSFEVVYPQLRDLDFTTQAPSLEVPVYIFAGRDDVNAMSSLVAGYFDQLQAPHKELIWLDGGHGLNGDNLGQFVDVMVEHVLGQTQAAR